MSRYPRSPKSNDKSVGANDGRDRPDGDRRSRDDRETSSSRQRDEGSRHRKSGGDAKRPVRRDDRSDRIPREARKHMPERSERPLPSREASAPLYVPLDVSTVTSGAPQPDSTDPVRINKALAGAGICSRRAADDLIAQGAVAINGETITTPGVKVTVGKDVVTVNGVTVNLGTSRLTFSYVIINKPTRVVTTVNDPQGRTTVLDLLPMEMKKARLFPVGRLDYFSEGLLLLTDDGELTYRLTHPKWHLPKVYRVRIRGKVSDAALRTMRSGMTLAEGEELAPIKVNVLREENGITMLELHLIQGINRQIRRMCRDLDLTILSLKRYRHGPIDLGNLDRGKARFLDATEIAMLHRATGLE